MESKDNVEPAAARLSASPRGPVEEAEGLQSATTGTPINIRSSPPALEFDNASNAGLRAGGSPEDVGVKSDSEAETIVLPGKDGHSPSKIRKTKSIKHEDKSEDEQLRNGSDIESRNGGRSGSGSAKSQLRRDDQASELATSTLGKRKRSKHGHSHIHADDPAYTGNSSGLSSVPTSPIATTRSSLSKPAASDSDVSNPPSPRITSREAKSVDRVLSRRKQSNEDEIQTRKFSRQQSSGGDHKQTREKRTSSVSHDIASHQRTRSISPPSRIHKRSISTQLPAGAANGLGHKKKRVPAPLQSTEYQSDASSVSEGDHPRGSRVRHLAAPATGDSAISPAKMPSHKKSGRDHHGLTLLARACSSGNLEQARIRLEERPDDLDLPDNSGNTPLQHASLKGHDNIVKFLLDAGCLVDSINVAKDTPLIDAVDNGHLAVVKLLLDAGANPRQPNVHGAEPISRVDPDDDDADEMKAAIAAAIETYKPPKDQEGRLSHPTDSPRQTPPIATPHQPGFAVSSRRGAGGRSVKTSNELLYKSSDVHELRRAAGEGETENVGRILELKHGQNSWNDAETLVIAAKAGHIEILNLLLAYNFDPDPDPLVSMERTEPQFATPMLAAIGRNSERYLPVIELFVEQSGFNPTRKLKGETYSDIAKRRAGTFWEREKQILDEAAEKYKKTHKYSPVQPRSPGLRRDAHRESKRSRDEPEQPSRPHKRRLSSPKAKDTEPKKRESSTSGQVETKRGHQRSNSSTSQPKDGQAKRGPGRPRKDERTPSTIVSDRETTPLGPPKPKSQPRRSESDLATASDTEAVKPRRKLVSGKDLKGEREREKEKQRRASVVSTASSASAKERHGPSESKSGTLNSKGPRLSTSDLEHDRARSLKRDDSKDRLSAIRGESPAKRQRTSVTPPRVQSSDAGEGTVKRRKLDPDSKERRKADSNFSSSPDHHNRDRTSTGKSGLSRERTSDAKDRDRKSEDTGKSHSHKTAKRSSTSSSEAKENSKSSKDEDVVMEDRDQVKAKADKERETRIRREKEKEKDREAKEKEAKEKEAREKEAREKEAKEKEAKEQEAKEQEAKEKAAKEKEEAEKKAEEAKQKEEAAKREEEYREQLKQARIAREKLAEEAEVKRLEEEARQREIQRQADADALHRAQAEKQRLYQEQQEKAKEEQELARKKREEERQKMAQLREKERLEKLPFLLRWFDQTLQPINAEITNLFRHMEGFRADTINGELAGQPAGRDQWLLNTHVALLLGEKDLSLSRYTSWEHIDLTPDMKKAIYLYEGTKYSLTHSELKGIRTALLGNEYGTSYEGKQPIWKLSDIARPLFIEMPMFFVKLSEFMYIVPRFPHLRGVEMVVHYRELIGFPAPLQPETPKYEQDPDHDPRQKWMPLPKYYKDGNFVRQGVPKRARLMTSQEVLRRDQERQQIASYQFPSPTTNNYRSISSGSPTKDPQTNGMTPPKSDKSVNGGSPHQGPIPNGVSASPTSETVDVVMESL